MRHSSMGQHRESLMSSHFSHIPFPDNRAIRMQRIGTTELKACALKQWADKVALEECYSRGRQLISQKWDLGEINSGLLCNIEFMCQYISYKTISQRFSFFGSQNNQYCIGDKATTQMLSIWQVVKLDQYPKFLITFYQNIDFKIVIQT